MTPVSFKMTSSSGSMNSSEKHKNDMNVSEAFPKLPERLQSGFHKKLKSDVLQVITNIQVVKDLDKQEKLELDNNNEVIYGNSEHREIYDTFFPRIAYLNLDSSLIQIHLDIFKMLRPLPHMEYCAD